MNFEWDKNKEHANIAKHGVDFAEARLAFDDPCAIVLLDESHGGGTELRWWLLGKIGARVLLVRYTQRSPSIIRIIGAGYWSRMEEIYNEKNKTH